MGAVDERDDVDGENNAASATKALASMVEILALDGYELRVEWPQGAALELVVVAGVAACDDCLIPVDLFRAMAADKLGESGLVVPESQIHVRYPPT